jgi:hypothetical protein
MAADGKNLTSSTDLGVIARIFTIHNKKGGVSWNHRNFVSPEITISFIYPIRSCVMDSDRIQDINPQNEQVFLEHFLTLHTVNC